MLVLFPATFYGVMQKLAIQRTADFLYAGGMLAFSALLFYMYTVTKQTQKRMEMLVRKVAIKEGMKEEKKKK